MSENDQILLDSVLSDFASTAPAHLNDAERFELFGAAQVLKDSGLSDEELLAGLMGGGDEGGVDGLYVFLDGRLLEVGAAPGNVRRRADLTLQIVQAKRSPTFGEAAIQKISDTLSDVLQLSTDLGKTGLYHTNFVERANVFRDTLKRIANKAPNIRVVITYASRGDTALVSSRVARRAEKLENQVIAALPNTSCEVTFLGARELYDLSQTAPEAQLELQCAGDPQSDGQNGYVALARLADYFSFIDDSGTIRRYIFEGNVRDFGGAIEVNRQIGESLENPSAPQFWWLNNGVTIVCSKITVMNQRFYLDNPLIVNGLQTSMVLHASFAAGSVSDSDPRLILVRVIEASDPVVLDQIIRSTNSQTPVSAASLHATDRIQRDIEKYFLTAGLHYDRRKNFYRNQGKASDSIVSIPYLAQAIMAIGLSQPDDARARPSTLIKRESEYKRVFNPKLDLEIYHWIAVTQRAVDQYLRAAKLTPTERTNLRFHVSMLVVARKLGKPSHEPRELKALLDWVPDSTALNQATRAVRREMDKFAKANGQSADQVAKNRDFVKHLLSHSV